MGKIKYFLLPILLTSVSLFAVPNMDNNNTKTIKAKHIEKKEGISKKLKQQFRFKRAVLLKNINNKKFLQRFYRKNNYQSIWYNKNKRVNLFRYIKNDLTLSHDGLIYKNYQLLNKELESNTTQHPLREELKLTSLYHDFLNHTLYGGIQWRKFSGKLSSLKRHRINASWIRHKAPYSVSKLLLRPDINATMDKITPKKFGYQGLLKSLEKLNKIKEKGGWKELPYFKRLALGSTGEMVVQLRERLKISGDYQTCLETSLKLKENNLSIDANLSMENNLSMDSNLSKESNQSKESIHISPDAIFGTCLDTAVKKFQTRHGLLVDGIVGGGTRGTLNISIDKKIRTVLLNIDRIKWLPREVHERYLVVNIPEFMLHYFENEEMKKELRVIVGDKKHPTPVFNQKISYIVLNPYWKIPEGIVRREIVPHMIKNPNYLRKQGLQAHRTWDENSRVINISNLYWEDYRSGGQKFPYRLMQPPGPRNALGKIKFKFPNRFAVYLHDTPTRHLFKKTVRAFSHGCVRLSKPEQLLETIASFNENINLAKAKRTLKGKRKKQLNIKNKLPIHIVYLTAGMNENNESTFRNDIYRYDKFMIRNAR